MSDGLYSRQSRIAPLYVVTALAVVAAIFWPTFRDLIMQGGDTEQHTHRIFVFPIFLWLLWERRSELAATAPDTCWWGLAGVLLCCLVWLIGDLAFIQLFTELAVVAMLGSVALVMFGIRWFWALSFPFAFLIFIVPIRGPLVGLQVDLTAKFSYAALLATGIPVHREGPYFELSTGKWSIAAACSGIEYLSACTMLATLYAWSMYASWRKRAIFILGAFLVGISGNWLRAYLTILVAHVSDNRYLRDSHGTFGWILFAALLFIYCSAGWYFRDREVAPPPDADANKASVAPIDLTSATTRRKLILAGLVVLAVLAITRASSQWVTSHNAAGIVEVVEISPVAGWSQVPTPLTEWAPYLFNPVSSRTQIFEKNGKRVGVFVGVFARQSWRSKLVTSVNDFIDDGSERWTVVERRSTSATLGQKNLSVNSATILGNGSRILAWQWYAIGSDATASGAEAKFIQLKGKLAGEPDTGAWVVIYVLDEDRVGVSTQLLADFARDMGPALDKALMKTTRP